MFGWSRLAARCDSCRKRLRKWSSRSIRPEASTLSATLRPSRSLLGEIDDAHPAASEHGLDPEAGDLRADSRARGLHCRPAKVRSDRGRPQEDLTGSGSVQSMDARPYLVHDRRVSRSCQRREGGRLSISQPVQAAEPSASFSARRVTIGYVVVGTLIAVAAVVSILVGRDEHPAPGIAGFYTSTSTCLGTNFKLSQSGQFVDLRRRPQREVPPPGQAAEGRRVVREGGIRERPISRSRARARRRSSSGRSDRST